VVAAEEAAGEGAEEDVVVDLAVGEVVGEEEEVVVLVAVEEVVVDLEVEGVEGKKPLYTIYMQLLGDLIMCIVTNSDDRFFLPECYVQ